MNYTKIISVMMALGLVNTVVFADATNTTTINPTTPLHHTKEKVSVQTNAIVPDTNNTGYLNQDMYWMRVINRNQDNAYYVIQPAGNMKLTGIAAVDLAYNSMRYGFSADPTTYKRGTSATLSVAELYFDAQVNPWTALHLAMTYDRNTGSDNFSYSTDNKAPTISGSYGTTQLFFDEAYAFFNYNNLFMRVGRQLADFGSAMRTTIAHPTTQFLSTLDETGVTLGAMNPNGLYGDVFIYQGAPYGLPGAPVNGKPTYGTINNNGANINGYTMAAGYALNQGKNAFYGYDGLRTHIDYIGNIADVVSLKWTIFYPGSSASYIPVSQVPGLAAHVDYTVGAFQIMADYVTALARFNQAALAYNNKPAQPSAYSIAGTYSWDPNMVQGITLGYDGSRQAVQVTPIGSGVNIPANRMLLSYSVLPAKNVRVRVEYGYAQDYAKSVGGTGTANNSLTTRLQVVF